MEKNKALDIIDYAILETKNAHEEYSAIRYCGAIKQYIKHFDKPQRADGFTRFNGARDNFNTLSINDIYGELLKNIIRLKGYREAFNERQALKTPEYFDSSLHPLEKEEWLYHQIMYYPLEGIDEMMKNNDEILNSLIYSFVDSRYSFNKDKDYKYDGNLDDLYNLTDQELNCLNEIDKFYKEKTYKH